MKKINLFILVVFCFCNVQAQSNIISNDGRYVAIKNYNTGPFIIQSTTNSWKKELSQISNAHFTSDSKSLIVQRKDSLISILLGTSSEVLIAKIDEFDLQGKNEEWLVYKPKDSKELILHNLITNREQKFANVEEYKVSELGNVLVIKSQSDENGVHITQLKWTRLDDFITSTVWQGSGPEITTFDIDAAGGQLAFMVKEKNDGSVHNAIWYFKDGMDKSLLYANDGSAGIGDGMVIAESEKNTIADNKSDVVFSKDGKVILFFLTEKQIVPRPNPYLSDGLEIWSYKDPVPFTMQKIFLKTGRQYASAMVVANKKIIRLENENEVEIGYMNRFSEIRGDYALVCRFQGDLLSQFDPVNYNLSEYPWNSNTLANIYLVSTKDGSRILLKKNIKMYSNDLPYYRLSPGGKFVIYYDPKLKNYFSYEIAKAITRNLTNNLIVGWTLQDPSLVATFNRIAAKSDGRGIGIVNWVGKDSLVIVGDQFRDWWILSPDGKNRPVNCTNGYFHKHPELSFETGNIQIWDQDVYKGNTKYGTSLDRLAVWRVFNKNTTQTGFFIKKLNELGDPKLTSSGSFNYNTFLSPNGENNYRYGLSRAADVDMYLVNRESVDQPPRFFWTKNFKNFTPVNGTNEPLAPKALKKELITWRTFSGKQATGVLIKPHDFDPQKKYPVLVEIYEGYSIFTKYNSFEKQSENPYEKGNFEHNPSLALKHGYLVFYPGIDSYTVGGTGQSVYDYIVSGVKQLAKSPNIDAKHIGLLGHSFGAYETNYLITHTNIFAAAWSSHGISDLVSKYGIDERDDGGFNQSSDVEIGQQRIGATMWDRPDLYIKNSPIFYADRVTTPLIITSAKDDYRVHFAQSVELFKALRRMGKPVWFIAMTSGRHPAEPDGRFITQFFDHYLKSDPAPIWMTKSISTKMQTVINPFEYDATIKTPGPGIVMDDEAKTPQQRELLRHRTVVSDDGRILDVRINKKKKNNK